MRIIVTIVTLIAGAAAGLALPDADHWLPYLVHRSIFTHGFLLPVIAYFLVRNTTDWARLLLVGFCVATAAHLSFDLFPERWMGFALIKIPGMPRTPDTTTISVLWIASSIVVCLYLAVLLCRDTMQLALAGAALVTTFLLSLEANVWPPLVVLIGATVLVLMLPSSFENTQKNIATKFGGTV